MAGKKKGTNVPMDLFADAARGGKGEKAVIPIGKEVALKKRVSLKAASAKAKKL